MRANLFALPHVNSFIKTLSLFLTSCLIFACSGETWKFYRLKSLRREPDKASSLAHEIKDTQSGIRLAAKDFNAFGGSNRGMSSWILEQSNLGSEVESLLVPILDDPKENLSRKFEAARILWERSLRKNFKYLDQMFLIIKRPGSFGRHSLRISIGSTSELASILDVHHSKLIPMSLEEFQKLSRQPGMISMNFSPLDDSWTNQK